MRDLHDRNGARLPAIDALAGHYCITTGWCNRPLEAIGFFRRLERAITALTGAHPRQDDDRYQERYGAAAALARND